MPTQQVWRFSGGVWNPLGSFSHGSAEPLSFFGSQHIVGVVGDATTTPSVQFVDGQERAGLCRGVGGGPNALCELGIDIIAGGSFHYISNIRVNSRP